MLYYSTRNKNTPFTLSEAITLGLAPDGGLFMPDTFPQVDISRINKNLNYAEFAHHILKDFFIGDNLEKDLAGICDRAFHFPVPLIKLNDEINILELFHGPTLSFKDFGASFLAECLNILAGKHKITIMVATSGDTGSAVANAFYHKDKVNVVVLYPEGLVSKRQEQQITCYDDNVIALKVDGSFDDCQKIVKDAFADNWWQSTMHVSSANSINLGRLLPQVTYYAYTSFHEHLKTGKKVNFVVPTGNLGNATAAYFAREMGFPIDKIVLATNANHVISNFLDTGEFKPQPSISTLANAMDVGNPSNFERLHNLYSNFDDFKHNVSAYSITDQQITVTIKEIYDKYDMIICPHTATGIFTLEQIQTLKNLDYNDNTWIAVATAHPSKFESIIEPTLGIKLPVPPQLAKILNGHSKFIPVAANLSGVKLAVQDYFASK